MNKLSRLSDMNIQDDILRGLFYRSVIKHVNDPTANLSMATVRPLEEYRPDIMAYRLYGTADLRWLVCLITGNTDEAEPLPVGEEFKFPDVLWIRQTMRDFLDAMEA